MDTDQLIDSFVQKFNCQDQQWILMLRFKRQHFIQEVLERGNYKYYTNDSLQTFEFNNKDWITCYN